MSSNRVSKGIIVSLFAAVILTSSLAVAGQVTVNKVTGLGQQGLTQRPMSVAERNNLYCAGYVQTAPVDPSMEIVGGHEEQDHYLYAQNNVVYLNAGA